MTFRGSSKAKVRPASGDGGLDPVVVALPAALSAPRPRPTAVAMSTRFRQMLSSSGSKALSSPSDRSTQRICSKQSSCSASQASGGGVAQMVGSSIAKMPFSARSYGSVSTTASDHRTASTGSSLEVRSATKDSCSPLFVSEQDSVDGQRSTPASGPRNTPGRSGSAASCAITSDDEGKESRGTTAKRNNTVRSIFSDDTVEPRSLTGGSSNSTRAHWSENNLAAPRSMTQTSIDSSVLGARFCRSMPTGDRGCGPRTMVAQIRARNRDASKGAASRSVPQPQVHLPPEDLPDDGDPSGSDADESDEWLQRNGVWPPNFMPGAGSSGHMESPTADANSSASPGFGKMTPKERFRLRLLRKHGFLECPRDVRIKKRGPNESGP